MKIPNRCLPQGPAPHIDRDLVSLTIQWGPSWGAGFGIYRYKQREIYFVDPLRFPHFHWPWQQIFHKMTQRNPVLQCLLYLRSTVPRLTCCTDRGYINCLLQTIRVIHTYIEKSPTQKGSGEWWCGGCKITVMIVYTTSWPQRLLAITAATIFAHIIFANVEFFGTIITYALAVINLGITKCADHLSYLLFQ